MKLSFIGTGNMGGALVRGICTAFDPAAVCLSNRTPAKAEALARDCGCRTAPSNADCARDADFIFLGVKPNLIRPVLAEILPVLTGKEVLVSMAAGITGAAMREIVGSSFPIVRILPNTPCAIGEGLILIAPCGNVTDAQLNALTALLSPCGSTAFTEEAHADAGMVIGGCTPAYAYLFIDALAEGAVAAGLHRTDAVRWAAQAVSGAAKLLLESGKEPAVLKDAVCSPGGSTIAGVTVLEDAGFRDAVSHAVSAAFEKNKALGR